MANVVITIRIMPESPDVDLKKLEEEAKPVIAEFGGDVGKVEINPIAFGLKALDLTFVMDEEKGSTDELEAKLAQVESVQSVEVTHVTRAVG